MEDNEEEVLDVPETSDDVVDTSTNDNTEDNSTDSTDNTEEIEEKINQRANELFEKKVEQRLARDRAVRERETNKQLEKYRQLENIIEAGLGVDNIDDAINKTSDFYKGQGVEIPKYTENTYSKRDETILAEADAKEIIDLGKNEMEAEANRIANIPQEERTERESIIFNRLCQELTNLNDIEQLKAKGYKTDVLNTEDFKKFREQFTLKTPISNIYELYTKAGKKPEIKNPGSVKTTQTSEDIKDYYTPEEARKFTEEDLANPKLMKALEHSMILWGKTN